MPVTQYYEETIATNFSGPVDPIDCSVVIRKIGKMVTITFGDCYANGNNVSAYMTPAMTLPAIVFPEFTINEPVIIVNNGVTVTGNIQISPSGAIMVSNFFNQHYTASTIATGFYSFSISYATST
jgi:hypothetical protein